MSFAFTEEKDCEIEFRPVGCYNDVRDSRALREEIYNEVDPSSPVFGGQLIGNWTAEFPVFLCKCARIAKAKGYQYFGVNSFGRKEITGNDVMLHWYNKSDYERKTRKSEFSQPSELKPDALLRDTGNSWVANNIKV